MGDINSVENVALLFALERESRDENPVLFSTTSFMFSPAAREQLRMAGLVKVANQLESIAADDVPASRCDKICDRTYPLRHLMALVFQAGRIA
jgi:hypothetical protein